MNGWKNKETWLVSLWLGDSFAEQAEDGVKITKDFIRETVEYLVDSTSGVDPMVRDLLNCALGEIDYVQLGQHYMSDGPTDDDDPEDDDDTEDDDYPDDGYIADRAEYYERMDMGRNEAGEWLGFM